MFLRFRNGKWADKGIAGNDNELSGYRSSSGACPELASEDPVQ